MFMFYVFSWLKSHFYSLADSLVGYVDNAKIIIYDKIKAYEESLRIGVIHSGSYILIRKYRESRN